MVLYEDTVQTDKFKPFTLIVQFAVPALALTIFRVFSKVHFEGASNAIPLDKGLILASNHTSELDVIFIRAGLPFFWKGSPIYFVSLTKEYYPKSRFGWRSYFYGGTFFNMLGAYPVYKGLKNYAKALVNHFDILEKGGTVCIFPEGKIKRDNVDTVAHGGVAYLAHSTHTPVVPVHVSGFEHLSFKKLLTGKVNIRVAYGKPMSYGELFPQHEPTVENLQSVSRRIMERAYSL